MVKIILCGCNGRMGKVIADAASARDDCSVVAGIDITRADNTAFPVFSSLQECTETADVIVDFSHPSTLPSLLQYAEEKQCPAVIATTGFSADDMAAIHTCAKKVPLFFSGNYSLGINLLMELAKKAAAVLGQDFDVEILEKHHNQKLDAPSGTALMLAKAVEEGLNYEPEYTFERHSVRQKRGKHEIGISAMRGGTIVGEHEVMFAGRDEIITLSHSARSRDIFAVGALNAALFLAKQPAGLYSMADLVK